MPSRQGSSHDSLATYRSFVCKDATQIVVTANTKRMWLGLCKVLGVQQLARDTRFLTNKERHANREVLYTLIEPPFLARTAEEWVPLLEAEGGQIFDAGRQQSSMCACVWRRRPDLICVAVAYEQRWLDREGWPGGDELRRIVHG